VPELLFWTRSLSFANRYKLIRGRQLSRLRALYDTAQCPRLCRRTQTVLLFHEGYHVAEIARITRQSCHTVRRWLHRFEKDGCAGVLEAPHPGRPPESTPAIEQFLRDAVLTSPRNFGLPRPTWTTALLARVVKRRFRRRVSAEGIRQHLQRIAGVCRRPTWTVKHRAQQQPGYAQKKGH
jgi:transposase